MSGENILCHVEKIVSFGPHPPGSTSQKQVGAYLIRILKSYGLKVKTQSFLPLTPQGHIEMTNIWGIVEGKKEQAIVLASHYDSKYFKTFSFVGANDSGSSTGLVLELAKILSRHNPTDYSLWFVFFDGEEAFHDWSREDSLYGSRELVQLLKSRGQLKRISALILLDLVGGKKLSLRKDVNSTPRLNSIIWRKGGEMGHEDIFQQWGSTRAEDDHIPFAEEGIPVVDIIDLNYAYWHRAEDTLDKLSPHNLEIVGNVVLESLPAIAAWLTRAN